MLAKGLYALAYCRARSYTPDCHPSVSELRHRVFLAAGVVKSPYQQR
jgi:hypothetical protein